MPQLGIKASAFCSTRGITDMPPPAVCASARGHLGAGRVAAVPAELCPLFPAPACVPWGCSCRAALGAGGTTSLEALRRADAAWRSMRTRTEWGPRPEFVRTAAEPLGAPADVDVAVCGGVLGIFLACALQLQGGPQPAGRRGIKQPAKLGGGSRPAGSCRRLPGDSRGGTCAWRQCA